MSEHTPEPRRHNPAAHPRRPGGAPRPPHRASPTPPPPARRRKRRRLRGSVRRGLILVVTVVVLLSLAWVITGFIERATDPDASGGGASGPAGGLPPGSSDPNGGLPAVAIPNDASWNFVGPVEQAVEQMQLVNPDKRMLCLPENGRVDMQYFNTAVFIGDSITVGLANYITNATFCAYVGVGPRSIYSGQLVSRPDGTQEVPIDVVAAAQPDNVYILLGTNSMVSMSNEAILAYYGELIDALRERLGPAVGIYLQSVTPVLAGKSYTFNPESIAPFNDELAKLAWEKGAYYLDLHEALAGDDGWLREDYGAPKDGYHLMGAGYRAWVEYLVTHTAYNPRHAHLYLEGSHYYQQTPPA